MISKCAKESFKSFVKDNKVVYIVSKNKNKNKKLYNKVLMIIGGATKIQESIYSNGDDKFASPQAPYISKKQIKKLGGNNLFSPKHYISVNTFIILKHILLNIKYYEENIIFRKDKKNFLFNFCKSIQEIIENQGIIQQILPDIKLKFKEIKNDPDTKSAILMEIIDKNIKFLSEKDKEKFNCDERDSTNET